MTSSPTSSLSALASLSDLSLTRSRDDTNSTMSSDRATDVTDSSSVRKSKRRSFLHKGRSLSPFHLHSSTSKRSPSQTPLAHDDEDSLEEKEEGKGNHDRSKRGRRRSRLCPRNTAFDDREGASDEDDDEEIALSRPKPTRKGTGWSERSTDSTETARGRLADAPEIKVDSSTGEQLEGDSEALSPPEDDSEDSDDLLDGLDDPEVLDNTLYNAGCLDLHGAWNGNPTKPIEKSHYVPGTSSEEAYVNTWGPGAGVGALPPDFTLDEDELAAPNVVLPSVPAVTSPPAKGFKPQPSRKDTVSSLASVDKSGDRSRNLVASRPLFERNRCTITLVHGEYEKAAAESKRPKRYIVASDGSEEASYAIEWTIGTVLRDGDETLVVSVMETDSKIDPHDPAHEDKIMKAEIQKVRQAMALVLARQATSLLQRTRLGVKISCQALHAKNARHMLLDMIDFYGPTMVIVGSRGLGSLKGILLGSTSHYLVQKSSVPVMVARRRLKLPPLPRGRKDVVESVRARHMRLDEAAIEKESNVAEPSPEEEGGKVGKVGDDGEGEEHDANGVDGKGGQTSSSSADDDDADAGAADSTPNEVERKSRHGALKEQRSVKKDRNDNEERGRGRSRSRGPEDVSGETAIASETTASGAV